MVDRVVLNALTLGVMHIRSRSLRCLKDTFLYCYPYSAMLLLRLCIQKGRRRIAHCVTSEEHLLVILRDRICVGGICWGYSDTEIRRGRTSEAGWSGNSKGRGATPRKRRSMTLPGCVRADRASGGHLDFRARDR